ncbi:hypothetical protein GCM10009642_30190 [Nocardiopsis metallicus]
MRSAGSRDSGAGACPRRCWRAVPADCVVVSWLAMGLSGYCARCSVRLAGPGRFGGAAALRWIFGRSAGRADLLTDRTFGY